MARGYSEYHDENEDVDAIRPSRPPRRVDSQRYSERPTYSNTKYEGGHYAESPIMLPAGSERNLHIVQPPARKTRSTMSGARGVERSRSAKHRSSTLPSHGQLSRTSSRDPNAGTVSKITRSRSLSSRPAGVAVYHPNGSTRMEHDFYTTTRSHHTTSRPGTRMSTKSSHLSGVSAGTAKSTANNTTKAGVVVETMSAPNPFCPNTRGVCCLMVLINLGLILVCIGFIIVLQLPEPVFIWNIGIVILVFGFLTFFVSLVYCMCICQESSRPQPGRPPQGELYWTHHWQKNITIPEIRSRDTEKWEEQDRFPEDELSDTSSRDYPRLYLESDYGQRTDREADFETEHEGGGGKSGGTHYVSTGDRKGHERDRY